jgi:hypothetical protein
MGIIEGGGTSGTPTKIENGGSSASIDGNGDFLFSHGSQDTRLLMGQNVELKSSKSMELVPDEGNQDGFFKIRDKNGNPLFRQFSIASNSPPYQPLIDGLRTGGETAEAGRFKPSSTITIADTNVGNISPDRNQGIIRVNDQNGEVAAVAFDLSAGTATLIHDHGGNVEALNSGGSATDGALGVEADSASTQITLQNELGGSRDIIYSIDL